jgi:hypothetical protein
MTGGYAVEFDDLVEIEPDADDFQMIQLIRERGFLSAASSRKKS